MQNIKGITMKQEMMEQEQKENLLRLLDDQDVKDKIIELLIVYPRQLRRILPIKRN